MPTDEEFSAKVKRIQDAVECVRGRASADGIAMTVSTTGRIVELEIGAGAYHLSPRILASTITRVHEEALAHADVEARTVRAELADDPRVHRIIAAADSVDPPRRPSAGYR